MPPLDMLSLSPDGLPLGHGSPWRRCSRSSLEALGKARVSPAVAPTCGSGTTELLSLLVCSLAWPGHPTA